jgi:hypothetical protein
VPSSTSGAAAERRKALTSDDSVVGDEALLRIGKRNVGELESEVWKFLDSEAQASGGKSRRRDKKEKQWQRWDVRAETP